MKRMKCFGTAIATAGLLALAPVAADAAVINFGVNILSNGTFSQTGFTNGDDTGLVIDNGVTPFVFYFDTPGLAGATINRFELFIDGTNVDCDGTCDGSALDDKFWMEYSTGAGTAGTWSGNQGYLQETSHASSLVPVNDATFGNHAATPYNSPSDIDNTFYLYNAPFAALQTRITSNGRLYFRIDSNNLLGSTNFRFDAANLEIDYTAPATQTPVPEPGSLLLLGSGLAAVARAVRRRRSQL